MRNQSGQALLLVLLSMAVVLTIVLSILSRSVTDVKITSQDEESFRAFSAAEAGVEQALVVGSSTGSVPLGGASFSANVSSFAEGAKEISFPAPLVGGETQTLWFVSHDTSGRLVCDATRPCFTGRVLNLCWGKAGAEANPSVPETPALAVSLFYTTLPGNYSTVRVARAAFDPNGGRRAANSFAEVDPGTCKIGSETFAFQKNLNLSSLGVPEAVYNQANGLQFLRLRLIYNSSISHPVGVDVDFPGNSSLPAQGYKIESLGTAGEANRKIEVFESFAELPFIFSGSIISPEEIIK